MKLYEISDNFADLFSRLEDFDDEELTDEERADFQQAWFDTLEGIEEEFTLKAEAVALYIKELSARAEAIKAEEKRLAQRRKSAEGHAASLKVYLKNCMEQMHLKKVETARAKVSVRGTAPSLKITDESAFVEMLQTIGRDDLLRYSQPEIRKSEVKAAIKSGETFDGAELVAGQSLIIS